MDKMDVLRPQLVWIGRRCYRMNLIKKSQGYNPEDEEFNDREEDDNIYCDEACDADVEVEKTDRGYRLAMMVPSTYYKFIIGKKGETKRKLEAETHTRISIPKMGAENEEIRQDRKGIVSAKTRIDVLVDSARQKQQFTHFLSIPVTGQEVIAGFEDFKSAVLTQCAGDRGLDESLFQNPKKLHLTIGTLVLHHDSEIQRAKDLLSTCVTDVVSPVLNDGEGLNIRIRGLEYMNDDPGAVDVLYAKVEEGPACDRLQDLSDRLVMKFTAAGLMQAEHERVKLHVTVINTLMRKDPSGTSVPLSTPKSRPQPSAKHRESFHATRVLEKFTQFDFGPLNVRAIHLSQRFSTGDDGYYESTALIPLPR